MTRESEKSKIRMSVIVDGKHINSLKKADEVIDQIFDEHEAQLKLASDVYSTDKMHMYQELKAKESDLERQDMIIKCLNIDLDNKEKLLEAKDEEINTLMKENKTLNNLIELFMNEWYRCGRLPDTTDELILIDNVYEKMFEKLFKDDA